MSSQDAPSTPVELVRALMEPLSGDLVRLLADEEVVRELGERGAAAVDPDAPVSFHGPEGVVLGADYRGLAGLLAGWREWLSSFASYHFTIERVFQEGDRVVVLVRQWGRTIHGGVEVPSSPSAAVFEVRADRLARAAFYLDRAHAARAEGFSLP